MNLSTKLDDRPLKHCSQQTSCDKLKEATKRWFGFETLPIR